MTQYRNPEWSGTRLNMSTIDAAYTVLQSDSSKVFMLDGGGYTITLPVAAALEEGWHCKFVVRPANPTGDIVITATTAIVDLVMKDPGGDASNSTAGTAKTTVIFHTECTQGDYVNIFTDGSTYYAEAMSGVNDAIDHTQQ
tara:strand:- start:6 stop:428 length:423 start_codon:yes stop_codon:yes gene_type:complete